MAFNNKKAINKTIDKTIKNSRNTKVNDINTSEGIRLNKFLSERGVCSRREADRLIENGKVFVDGHRATVGVRVSDKNDIVVDGKAVKKADRQVLIAFNKPKGIVCTAEKRERNNIIDYIDYPVRIYPIGRLDKDSTGLILLTNRGDLVNKMMRASNYHEKEYIVKVNKRISDDFIRGMAGGVPLRELNTMTRKCHVKKIGDRKFKIILTQGLNRQIRRMCEYFDYKVVELKRVRVMNIELDNLPEGNYRDVTEDELKVLNKLLSGSNN
ncbi:MAG: 23S rRNA pseudouridine(2604) synthase RluF [Lachnospiraceae bacterium]|nr:23S rRNA pseudouridine(2604) synthase RluF [Lachnospiraceae bacterium]